MRDTHSRCSGIYSDLNCSWPGSEGSAPEIKSHVLLFMRSFQSALAKKLYFALRERVTASWQFHLICEERQSDCLLSCDRRIQLLRVPIYSIDRIESTYSGTVSHSGYTNRTIKATVFRELLKEIVVSRRNLR